MNQMDKAARFRALHEAAGAFVIGNAWDAGSARVLAGAGLRRAGDFQRRHRRRARPARRFGVARRGAGQRALGGRRLRLAGVGRPRERLRSRCAGGDRDHSRRGAGRLGRRFDRRLQRRRGAAAVPAGAGGATRRGRRAGRAGAAVALHADRALRELLARQPESRRHHRAAASLRARRCRRADGSWLARPRRSAARLRRIAQAVQLHGRHPRQVVHGGRSCRPPVSNASAWPLRCIAAR